MYMYERMHVRGIELFFTGAIFATDWHPGASKKNWGTFLNLWNNS